MLALLMPAVANASYLVDGMYYDIRNNEATLINGKPSAGETIPSEVVIPDSVTVYSRTYPVTSIGVNAFHEVRGMTSVVIPRTVKSIQFSAFYGCRDLVRVNICDLEAWCQIDFGNDWANPLYDGNYLYLNGEEVTDLVIPSSITEIKRHSFVVCRSLRSVTIPNSVTTVGYGAFMYCYELEEVNFSNSITTIGGHAFANCKSLTSLSLPEKLTTIEAGAFTWCTALTSVVLPDSVTTIGNYAFRECQSLASVNIPDGVTTICDQAFENCRLTSIEFPYSLTSIGSNAFAFCNRLPSLHIPSSVVSIGDGAFHYCNGFESITVDSDNPNYDSRGNCNALIETGSNTLLWGCVNTVIPNTVVTIGTYAFYRNKFTHIDIPNSVVTIGDHAFYYCDSMASLELPNSVTTIGNSAFEYCMSLPSVVIPNSVTTIGKRGFYYCNNLTDVTIPASVVSIGQDAFMICVNLTNVTIDSDNPYYDERDDCNAIIETATNTLLWGGVNTVIPNTVTAIADWAFFNVKNHSYMVIPNSVTSIGLKAFYGAPICGLKIGDGVTSIGEEAFSSCNQLLEVTIGNGITTLPNKAFYYCWQLDKLTIGSSVDSIGSNVFNNCNRLTEVTCLAKTPPVAGLDAFTKYTALLSVPLATVEAYESTSPWSAFTDVRGIFIGGDINGDGQLNISDVIRLISLLSTGGELPECGDVNGDGVVNVTDITVFINKLLN